MRNMFICHNIHSFINQMVTFFYNMNVHAHFLNRTVLTLYAVDNRRTVLLINASLGYVILICFRNHKLRPLIGSG